MDPARFLRVKEVLVEALARQAGERGAYLDAACAGDAELRAEVDDLLSRDDAPAPVVEHGIDSARVAQVLSSGAVPERGPIPETIGPYRITGVLGEGGMGVVYRGRQEEPIVREVAVKVLRRGLDTERVLERFAWERRTLALMDHPHIARILDAGSAADGRPYVVLELVDGEPITHWCREQNLSLDARLDLMIRVCRAVQHAHDRGVLHRDLKPSNVLVRQVDGAAVPSVIDFGIAKALEATDLELTVAGQVVGTPAYMSPEQRSGDPSRVDVHSDVYALGVMLYELLTGTRPGDEDTPTGGGDTPRPSRAAKPAGDDAGVPWRRRLRGDLDCICLMAVRPEPERRYPSALALAEDLQRYREGRPVLASPDSLAYRLGKSARRHPVWVALAAAATIFAVAGVVFLGYHADRLQKERTRALEAEQLARQEEQAASGIAGFLEGLFTEIDPEQGAGGDDHRPPAAGRRRRAPGHRAGRPAPGARPPAAHHGPVAPQHGPARRFAGADGPQPGRVRPGAGHPGRPTGSGPGPGHARHGPLRPGPLRRGRGRRPAGPGTEPPAWTPRPASSRSR